MKIIAFTIFTFMTIYSAAQTIKPEQAKGYIGKNVTVCGTVIGTHVSKSGTNFLDFGATYPHESFSAVVFAKDIQAHHIPPVAKYKGQNVCVTGKMGMYQNKPGIVVEDASQIR